MKLTELYNKPLIEALKELELTDMKIHSDERGAIKALELKYIEKMKGPKQINDLF